MFWNVRAMPRRTIPCGGVRKSVAAVELDLARVRRVEPRDDVEEVVLPAPFGPIRPATTPRSTSKETPSSATMPPNRNVTSRTESSIERGS